MKEQVKSREIVQSQMGEIPRTNGQIWLEFERPGVKRGVSNAAALSDLRGRGTVCGMHAGKSCQQTVSFSVFFNFSGLKACVAFETPLNRSNQEHKMGCR